MTAAPKTPEAVARNTGGWKTDTADAVERFVNRVKRSKADPTIRKFFVPVEEGEAVAAALREARAAAIEEAVRELEAFGDPDYYAEAIVAIRALGEESAG